MSYSNSHPAAHKLGLDKAIAPCQEALGIERCHLGNGLRKFTVLYVCVLVPKMSCTVIGFNKRQVFQSYYFQ